jgi:hypothetical protein
MIFNLEEFKQAVDKIYHDISTYSGESRDVDVEVVLENGDVSNEKFVDLIRLKVCSLNKDGEATTRTVEVFVDNTVLSLQLIKLLL